MSCLLGFPQFSVENVKRLNWSLFPPSPSCMQSLYEEGFNDTVRFLKREAWMNWGSDPFVRFNQISVITHAHSSAAEPSCERGLFINFPRRPLISPQLEAKWVKVIGHRSTSQEVHAAVMDVGELPQDRRIVFEVPDVSAGLLCFWVTVWFPPASGDVSRYSVTFQSSRTAVREQLHPQDILTVQGRWHSLPLHFVVHFLILYFYHEHWCFKMSDDM